MLHYEDYNFSSFDFPGNSIWAANMAAIPQSELFIPRESSGEPLKPSLSGFYMFWTMVILLQVGT